MTDNNLTGVTSAEDIEEVIAYTKGKLAEAGWDPRNRPLAEIFGVAVNYGCQTAGNAALMKLRELGVDNSVLQQVIDAIGARMPQVPIPQEIQMAQAELFMSAITEDFRATGYGETLQ